MPSAVDQERIERRELQRAIHNRDTNARRLREVGAEYALPHGRILFEQRCAVVAAAVNKLMAEYVANPKQTGPHRNALPLLVLFRDPAQVAAIGLRVVVDRLSQRQTFATACQRIGHALEMEWRAMRIERVAKQALMRMIRDMPNRQAVVRDRILEIFRVPAMRWPNRCRLELGALLLDVIASRTDLIEVYLTRRGRLTQRWVGPSPQSVETIRRSPMPRIKLVRQLMVVPPRPWTSLRGGGHLNATRPLVKLPVQHMNDPDESALGYLEDALDRGELRTTLEVVNRLQETPLRLDGWILQHQREAWDKGIAGLFPCERLPPPVPPKLASDAPADQWRTRNTLAYRAHRDRRQNGPKRVSIERTLQLAEEMPADTPLYQAWLADYRGRLYTANRYLSHQGGDMERALLHFERSQPVDATAHEWILMQAAAQDGCGRVTWQERLAYGVERLPRWVAVGRDPFARLELWRGAKEPWQLLQSCRELALLADNPGHRSGLPIRLDQTTSGCAHFAALMRDEGLMRKTNLIGDEPADLYQVVADRVNRQLEILLHTAEGTDRWLAEFWLGVGITRKWMKPGVLAAPYGGSHMGLQEQIIDMLEAERGVADPSEFRRKVAWPSVFLARIVNTEMRQEIEPVLCAGRWLRKLALSCGKKQQPMTLTGPSGFPVKCAEREATKERVELSLFGRAYFQGMEEAAPARRIKVSCEEQRPGSRLSGRLMSAAAPANFVHMLDAGLAHRVVQEAAHLGMDVLPVHDCFATTPSHAGQLHDLLHMELGGLHGTDWLAVARDEIVAATGKVGVPPLPERPRAEHLRIGSNPYAFC